MRLKAPKLSQVLMQLREVYSHLTCDERESIVSDIFEMSLDQVDDLRRT